jgi:hypothetical protein
MRVPEPDGFHAGHRSSPWKKSSGCFSTDENLQFSRELRRLFVHSLLAACRRRPQRTPAAGTPGTRKDAFGCAAPGTTIGIAVQRKLAVGLGGNAGSALAAVPGTGAVLLRSLPVARPVVRRTPAPDTGAA